MWADSLWLYSQSHEDLSAMLRDDAAAPYANIVLQTRWDKRSVARASPTDTSLSPDEQTMTPPLNRMEFAADGRYVRLLGATVPMRSSHSSERESVSQKSLGRVFLAETVLVCVGGHAADKLRVLHEFVRSRSSVGA